MSLDLERFKEILEEEGIISESARIYAMESGIEYSESLRKRFSYLYHKERKEGGVKKKAVDEDLEVDTTTDTNQYENEEEIFMPSAWDPIKNRFLNIDEYCDTYGLPKEQVRSSKLVAHLEKHIIYNIAFNPTVMGEATGIDEEFVEEIISKLVHPVEITEAIQPGEEDWFDRLVYTDAHVAMSTEGGPNIETLYEGDWNESELLKRLDIMVDHVLRFKKSNILVIDELGDYMDGLSGQTTRKGHDLPQNMSDKKAFEVGVRFKVQLIDKLVGHYDKIISNNIVEDNHAGVFGYFVNSTVKKIVEAKYPKRAEVNVLEKFMDHYSKGKHTFILTHGKDSAEMRFGMKPILDAKQIDKIDQYCKAYELYNGNYLELSKGDSHQHIFDDSTSRDFSYYNYPAFSPPSNWVKTNFGKSDSGFVFFNIDKKSQLKIKIPHTFKR